MEKKFLILSVILAVFVIEGCLQQPPRPILEEKGCSNNANFSCPRDFSCGTIVTQGVDLSLHEIIQNITKIKIEDYTYNRTYNLCLLNTKSFVDQEGCSVIDNKYVCALKSVTVKAPVDEIDKDIIAEKAQVLQKQYDFLASYLGSQPTEKIVLEYLTLDEFNETCGFIANGCTERYNTYWLYRIGNVKLPPQHQHWKTPGDHELNHAFVYQKDRDNNYLVLTGDFDEAQARYLTLKEEAYFNGFKNIGDYMEQSPTFEGYYFYVPEAALKNWTETNSSDEACKNSDEEERVQCKYFFFLVKYDQEGLFPHLFQIAINKTINLSLFYQGDFLSAHYSQEDLDREINNFIYSYQ